MQGGWQYLDGDGEFGAAQRFAEHIYEKRTAYDCLDLPGTPWAKLYRRRLFDEIRFPAGYTCFEDAVIHFLIFPAAEKIASIPQVVYAWRRNANGITFTSQGTKKAVQAYWIVEELLEQHRRIKQPCDELFYRNLTLQLSNYCYVCVAGLTEEEKQGVFACCCLLYQKMREIMKQNMRRLQSGQRTGADDLGVWTVEAAGKVVSVDCIISRDGKDRKKMIRILQSVSNMDRGGIETMLMNYYRHLDRISSSLTFW